MIKRLKLGKVIPREGSEGSFMCNIVCSGTPIAIHIECDDQTVEDTLDFTETVVDSLSELEPVAKDIIVRDLLAPYNDDWREGSIVLEDGTTEPVHHPELSAQEFKDKFILESISVTGVTGVEFWYQENGLFWGHTVFVNSLHGTDFSKAKAEYYG